MKKPVVIYHDQTLYSSMPVVVYHTKDQDAVCDSSEYGLSVQADFDARAHGVGTSIGAFVTSIKDQTRATYTSTPAEYFRYRYPVSVLLVTITRGRNERQGTDELE